MYKTTLLIVNVIFEGHARVIIKKSPVNLSTYRTLAEREGDKNDSATLSNSLCIN